MSIKNPDKKIPPQKLKLPRKKRHINITLFLYGKTLRVAYKRCDYSPLEHNFELREISEKTGVPKSTTFEIIKK